MAKMFTVTGTGKRPITINRDLKRPPRRKTILPITGKGKPGSRLAVKLPVQERPVRPVRRIKGVVSRIARGPKPIGIKPSLIPSAVPRPARK